MTAVEIVVLVLLCGVLIGYAVQSLHRARRTTQQILDEELGPRDDERGER